MSDPDFEDFPSLGFQEKLEKMGEAQVRADLLYGGKLATTAAKRAAMAAFLQGKELKRTDESLASMRRTAKWTALAAIAACVTTALTLITLIVRGCN